MWARIASVALLLVCGTSPVGGFVPTGCQRRWNGSFPRKASATDQNAFATEIDSKKLQELNECKSGAEARRILKAALPEGARFASISIPPGASDRPISDGDLAIQTKIRNKKYQVFDLIDLNGDRDADRASAGVLSVFLASSLSAIAVNQNLPGPEIVRFVIVWILSFAPLALVGYGIATPDRLQTLLVSLQRQLFPTYRQRMLQHEAGHFLMAHLLGFPIQGYSVNAVKNTVEFFPLNDPNAGRDRAAQLGFDKWQQSGDGATTEAFGEEDQNVPFYSPQGRGASAVQEQSVFRKNKDSRSAKGVVREKDDSRNAWPYRGLDDATLDAIAVVSLAGVAAELLTMGNAEGGLADLSQLKSLLTTTTQESWTDRQVDNRIRFALGYAMTQLRLNLHILDALALVLDQGGSLADCVQTIEGTTLNVSGSYERERRQRLQQEGVNLLERLLLNEKNAATEDTGIAQGLGGGGASRQGGILGKMSELITGDDPLYIAGGIALLFAAWASSGGLSLH